MEANWPRWIFASVAHHLKQVAITNNIPALIEHFDDRTSSFMQASDRAEIRITGPFLTDLQGECRLELMVNVLLTSRYDGEKNPFTILKNAGFFFEAMKLPIPVWNYGNEPGDFNDEELFLGCLTLKPGKDTLKVFHFGQIAPADKLKQSIVDARYLMYIER